MGKRRYKFDPPSLVQGRRGNQDLLEVWHSRRWGAVHSIKYSAMAVALNNWEKVMARKTYRIELKIDLTDEEGHAAMLAIAKQYARDILGSAMMLSERQRPVVALMTDDSFTGMEEFDVMEPSENLHT